MKALHTPAPWVARKVDYHVTIFTEAANYDQYQICEVWNAGPKEGNEELQKECNANADLIAAAPDLLNALSRILEYVRMGIQNEEINEDAISDEVLIQCADAIAIATGQNETI